MKRFVFTIHRLPRSIWNTRNVQEQRQLDPIVTERANHPISALSPKRWFQILLNCEKQQFVSCTSNLLEQMYGLPKCTMFLQKWILSLQDFREVRVLKQSQSVSFGSISHMTILFVFTSLMKIWNQSIQAFVTGFSPFCDGTCELIYWP